MVGEHGPEAIVPLSSNSNSIYGGVNLYVNANISNSNDARSLVDEVVRTLRRQISSGVMV